MTEPIIRNVIVQRPGHRTGKTIGLSPTGEHQTEQPTFKRSELADPAFVQEHQAEIELAMQTGRIVNDVASPSSVREWLGRTLPEPPAAPATPSAPLDRAGVDLSTPSSEQLQQPGPTKPEALTPQQRRAMWAHFNGR